MTLLDPSPGIALQTRRGRDIPNQPRGDRHPDSIRAAVEQQRENHPLADLRTISNRYNCVGLVFANRRTAVDTEDIEWILEDDGYRPLASESELAPGDLVIYRSGDAPEPSHIAIVLRRDRVSVGDRLVGPITTIVLSKWGYDGEYIHAIRDVPDWYGSPAEYWTERMPAS